MKPRAQPFAGVALLLALLSVASGCVPIPLMAPAMMFQPVYTPDSVYHDHVEAAKEGCDNGSQAECERYRVLVEDCMRRIGPSGNMWTWHEPSWTDRRACEGM